MLFVVIPDSLIVNVFGNVTGNVTILRQLRIIVKPFAFTLMVLKELTQYLILICHLNIRLHPC